jgi:hypothetical protein
MKPLQAGGRWPTLRRPLLITSPSDTKIAAGATAVDHATSVDRGGEVDCFEPSGDGRSLQGLIRQPTPFSDAEKNLNSDLVWLHPQLGPGLASSKDISVGQHCDLKLGL